jgi:antitoxin component YwqK of YwqJK toxin-antitoxin module
MINHIFRPASLRLPGIFLCIVVMSAGCQVGGDHTAEKEITEYYGTGERSRTYRLVNGRKEGIMKDFYTDGRLMAERLFRNDRQTGRTCLYYPDGQIKEVQYYAGGKKEGGDTVFYQSGLPQYALHYTAGKKDGQFLKWSEDGRLIFEAIYAQDSLAKVIRTPMGGAQ